MGEASSGLSKGVFALGLAGVAVLAAVSIAPSLGGDILDLRDAERVLANPRTASPGAAFSSEGEGCYTPLGEFSYAFDRAVFGDNALGMRLHGLVSAVAFTVLCSLVAAKVTGSRATGVVAGLLFAVHPLAVEPGAWIAARTTHCAGIFLAASGLVLLPGAEGPDSATPARIIGSTLLFAAACLAHPIALAWPLMVLVMAAFPLRETGEPFGRRVRPVVALLLPAVAFGIAHAVAAPYGAESRELELPGGILDYALRTFAATGRTIIAIVAPVRLAPDYSAGLTMSRAFGAVSIALVLGLVAIAWLLRRRCPAVPFFAGWTLVTVLPAAALTGGFGGDRYAVYSLFAASVLAAGLLGAVWRRAGSGGRLVAGSALAAAAVAMLISSMAVSSRWTDALRLRREIIRVRPGSPRAHLGLGRLYAAMASAELSAGSDHRAEQLFREARTATLKARDLGAAETAWRLVLGEVHYRWGYLGEASRHYAWVLNRAKEMSPAELRGRITPRMLADANVALGAISESSYAPYETSRSLPFPGASRDVEPPVGEEKLHLARGHYEQALEYEPDRAEALWRLGKILNWLGEFDGAVEKLTRASVLAPDRAEIHAALGQALETSMRYTEAEAAYRRAADLDEWDRSYAAAVLRMKKSLGAARRAENPEELRHRAEALKAFSQGLGFHAKGEFLDAYKAFKRAAGWRPDFAAAHQRAGICAFLLGQYEQWPYGRAREHLKAADLYQPRNLVTLYMLARTELKLGDLDRAEERLLDCIRVDASFGLAHLWMANTIGLYRDEPDYDDALAYVNTAVRLGTPGAAEVRDYLNRLKSGETEPDRKEPGTTDEPPEEE